MKRIGELWATLVRWENLTLALRRAAAGKRSRPDVAAFLFDWEMQVVQLQRQLIDGSYTPGQCRCFVVIDPKRRVISAAPFRDRVVHHALTQVLEPIFEKRFVAQSYACRTGYGTHRALDAAASACRRFRNVLQCDIQKYFLSIDHAILQGQLCRAIKCSRTLGLTAQIIACSNQQETASAYFPGDTLFTPYERRRGLPLGNQTSQFFANVYLNEIDHFVLRELQPGAFCRYVDDFLVFHDSKQYLNEARQQIQDRLSNLRLLLHEGKSRCYQTREGITFLGWRVFPDHKRLVRRNVVSARRRLRALQRDYALGRIDWEEVEQPLNSWNAHASHGDTWKLRAQMFDEFPFRRES